MDAKLLVFLQIGFYLISLCAAGALLKPIQQIATTNSTESTSAAATLLAAIQNEKNFSTLVIWRRKSIDCFTEFSNLSVDNLFGKLIFNANFTVYLNSHYNRDLFNVVCFTDIVDFLLLENMSESLEHMREARILFLLKNFTTKETGDLEELFSYCDQQQMLNVLAIHEDFAQTGHFYSFTRFPNFTLENFQWPNILYSNRLGDLQGYALRSIPSQSEPGSIIYTDRHGRKRSSGYVYHLISTFASNLNATLQYMNRANVGDRIEVAILQELTSNYELDLPICLQMPAENETIYGYSDIVEISNFLPMLPRAGYIERYEIHKKLLTSYMLIIDIIIFIILSLIYEVMCNDTWSGWRWPKDLPSNEAIFNDQIFRGVIGLSYCMRKERSYKLCLLYFVIFAHGIIWSTAYNGKLHAYFNCPPSGTQINSFDDLKTRQIQIVIPQEHFEVLEKIMPESFMQQYKAIFLIMYELHDFYALRKSLNTNYAYSVQSEIWSMIDRQQHYFTQRLFHISERVQFHRHMLLAVPLAENSVYRDAFNTHLLNIKAYGFWNHWTEMTLYEMVEAGKLSFEDLTKSSRYQALHVEDFYYIWLLYIGGNVLSCCCIIVEVLYKKLLHVNAPSKA